MGGTSDIRRHGIALAIAAIVAAAWLLLTPATADAHAELAASSPAAGAQLFELPSTVTLTFDEDVFTPAFVAVTGPDGTDYASANPTVDAATVTQAVSPSDKSGGFTMSYRVVSDDGHPVTGSIDFTVGGGVGSPGPTADDSSSFSGDHKTAIIVAVVAALAALAALALLVPRSGRPDPAER